MGPASSKPLRDRSMVRMGYIVTIGFFGYIIAVSFIPISASMDKVILGAILGTLGSQFTQVVSYYFGTSKGSADKAEDLAGQVTVPTQPDEKHESTVTVASTMTPKP
jgi:hypothetical protein